MTRRAVLLAAAIAASLALSAAAQEKKPGAPHEGRFRGSACAKCHTTSAWELLKPEVKGFDHAPTGFPLRAAHASVTCDRCHSGRPEPISGAACVTCHRDPHRGEQGSECDRCHNERTFKVTLTEGLQRHRATRFPLTGAHAVAECGACHLETHTNRFTGVPTDCAACHLREYQATTTPPHATSGLSTRCADCHRPTAWTAAKAFHDRFFPLRGAHAAVACASCHVNNRFAGTPRDCFSCHVADFNATTAPPHAAAGFPTTCERCHSDRGWTPSTFNHAGVFPLTGAHATTACTSCHVNNRYAGTPRDCLSCHVADYNATANPPHQTSGFGTDCQTCHSTAAWQPATFNHDPFFVTSSGAHARFRSDCNSCHPQPANKRVFTCVSCHNDRADVDDEHRGIPGYSYNDASCYQCHPRGFER